jgi:hypothetical protein
MSIKSIKPATLRKVITYLEEELGLSVYGSYRHLETKTVGAGCMDYDVDSVIEYRKLLMNNVEFTREKL